MNLCFFFVVMFLSGVWVYGSKYKHLLLMLLSLEYMVLSLFIMFYFMIGGGSFFYSLVFLTLTVCEGALGLSILVSMSRTHGSDYLSLMSV